VPGDVMAAGEGIETMLSLRSVLPNLPMVACLSQSSRRSPVPAHASTSLSCARRRSGWRRGDGGLIRSGPDSRDRGAQADRRRWATSTKTSGASASIVFE
jgi:hypothetical protein